MSEPLHPEKLKELLIGKTIKDFTYSSYIKWPMCVDSIEFTDGSKVNLGGNADNARIDGIELADGREFYAEVSDA